MSPLLSIRCLLIPKPNATRHELQGLARALHDWRSNSENDCSWLEHIQLIDMFGGRQPRSLANLVEASLAEMDAADRERVENELLGAEPGLSFSVWSERFDRKRTVESLRASMPSDLQNAVQDLLVDGISWNVS